VRVRGELLISVENQQFARHRSQTLLLLDGALLVLTLNQLGSGRGAEWIEPYHIERDGDCNCHADCGAYGGGGQAQGRSSI
jgi:hypothetical protein